MTDLEWEEVKRGGNALFDSVHKIMTILMAAAIAWMVNTVNTTAKDVAVLKVKVESAVSNRYSSADAFRDFALRDQKISDVERRVDIIERYIEKHNGVK